MKFSETGCFSVILLSLAVVSFGEEIRLHDDDDLEFLSSEDFFGVNSPEGFLASDFGSMPLNYDVPAASNGEIGQFGVHCICNCQ